MWKISAQFNSLYMHREKLMANSDIPGSSENQLDVVKHSEGAVNGDLSRS